MAFPVLRRKLIKPPSRPFLFPGRAAGFDSSHPLASAVYFSAIATPTGTLNLLTGSKGAITGTPTFSNDVLIGPKLVSASATDGANWTLVQKNDVDFTIAAILSFPVTNLQQNIVCIGSNNGAILRNNLGAPEVRIFGTVSLASGFSFTANTPYFYAASASRDTGSWNHAHVLVDLTTGKTLSSSTTGTAGGTSAATTSYSLAASPSGGGNTVTVACGMYSGVFSSLALLQQFAADPWSFWYPR